MLDKLQQLQQPQKVVIIYGPRRVGKPPKAWQEAYPSAHFSVIQQDNYLDFIT